MTQGEQRIQFVAFQHDGIEVGCALSVKTDWLSGFGPRDGLDLLTTLAEAVQEVIAQKLTSNPLAMERDASASPAGETP